MNAREAFDNRYHKIKADIAFDLFASIWNAAIAARDEELRKQEPYAWVTGGDCYADGHMDCKAWTTGEFTKPLYAAPVPPPLTPSQQELNTLISILRGGRQCDEDGREIIMSRQACCEAADYLESFILARPDATQWQPIETAPTDWGGYIVWHEKYGMETLFFQLKDGGLDGRKAGNWYSDDEDGDDNPKNWRVTHWMPLPARPDEVKP